MKPTANGEVKDEKEEIVNVKVGGELKSEEPVVSFITAHRDSTVAVDMPPMVTSQPEGQDEVRTWKGHYICSVLSTICCFGPLSVIGLVHFIAAKSEQRKGNMREALKKKRQATTWTAAAVTIGIIAFLIVGLLLFMGVSRFMKHHSEAVDQSRAMKHKLAELQAVKAKAGMKALPTPTTTEEPYIAKQTSGSGAEMSSTIFSTTTYPNDIESSSTTDMSSTTTDIPSTTTDILPTTTDIPSTTTDIPSTTTDIPSTTDILPTTDISSSSTTYTSRTTSSTDIPNFIYLWYHIPVVPNSYADYFYPPLPSQPMIPEDADFWDYVDGGALVPSTTSFPEQWQNAETTSISTSSSSTTANEPTITGDEFFTSTFGPSPSTTTGRNFFTSTFRRFPSTTTGGEFFTPTFRRFPSTTAGDEFFTPTFNPTASTTEGEFFTLPFEPSSITGNLEPSSTTTVPATSTIGDTFSTTISNDPTSTATSSTTAEPTTATSSTTAEPTTATSPATAEPTTATSSTTAEPTTATSSTTAEPTTAEPTTAEPTTATSSTTADPTTATSSTTAEPTTATSSTTAEPSTTPNEPASSTIQPSSTTTDAGTTTNEEAELQEAQITQLETTTDNNLNNATSTSSSSTSTSSSTTAPVPADPAADLNEAILPIEVIDTITKPTNEISNFDVVKKVQPREAA